MAENDDVEGKRKRGAGGKIKEENKGEMKEGERRE